MTVTSRRLQPLLRLNELATVELELRIETRRRALDALEAQRIAAAREREECYRRMVVANGATLDPRSFDLGADQAEAWRVVEGHLRARSDAERRAMAELQAERARLRARRQVIERRQRERALEEDAKAAARYASQQDDLWLLRRPS